MVRRVRTVALSLIFVASACSSPEPPVTPVAEPDGARAAPQPRPDEPAPLASAVEASASPTTTSAAPAPKPEPPPLRKGTVVLHVGDSFVHSGLTQRLRQLLEPHAVRYEVRAEVSTNSLDWAKRMPEIVASTQPDLVLVTLGGNEIGSKHLDVQKRAAARIVKAIGDRPCVWTSPPLWTEESGLFDAVSASVAPCRYFETDVVVGKFLPRRADKIHPTPEGGAMWAESLYEWLMRERTGQGWELAPGKPEETAPRGRRGPLPH